MRHLVGIPLLFAVFVAACDSNNLGVPRGSVTFATPAVYATWWAMVESCSARTAPFSKVTWFEAPDDAMMVVNGAPVSGYWDQRTNIIVVKREAKLDGSLVRHEMLHAISGSTAHVRRDFLETCGGVVACTQACLSAIGPYQLPGNAVPRVPPESLVITSVIEAIGATGEVADPFFRVTVWARNPAGHPVVVQLPPSGDAGPSLTFSYLISGSTTSEYNDRAWDSGVTYFGSQETKRRVFDFIVRRTLDMSFAITPGSYQFHGAFGERNATSLPLTIPP